MMPRPPLCIQIYDEAPVKSRIMGFLYERLPMDAESNRKVGARCRQVRTTLELTQTEMGAVLGVCKNTVLAIEKGDITPTMERVQRFARLGVSVGFIAGQDDVMFVYGVSPEKAQERARAALAECENEVEAERA